MKNRLIKNALGILFILICLISCDISDDNRAGSNCVRIIGVPTTEVTGPTEATINEEITLTVSFKLAAACGGFYRFYNESNLATQKNITVNASYDACNCDEVYSVKTEPFKFKATTAGVYTLNFKKTNDAFVTHVITVE